VVDILPGRVCTVAMVAAGEVGSRGNLMIRLDDQIRLNVIAMTNHSVGQAAASLEES
jgi:hypothetical protein